MKDNRQKARLPFCKTFSGLLTGALAGTLSLLIICVLLMTQRAYAGAPYVTYTVDGYDTIVETQTAYLPYATITKIGNETLKTPTDFTVLKDGTMYILDSGNRRVVVADADGELVMTFGEDVLVKPRGIFTTPERYCYVADRDAHAIFVFNPSGQLEKTYEKPTEAMYGETMDFMPLKIVVNPSGTMFLVCESNTNGIVEISPADGGTFLGYFGTNTAHATLWDIIWRSIQTDAQKAKQRSNLPATPDNLAIDEKGIIYTVTRGEASEAIKRLNIAGVNMIDEEQVGKNYDEVPAAVAVGNHDNIFVVSQQGYIYEYNNEGQLLFVFGGSDDGLQRIGLSIKSEAIQIGADDKIYVLDSDKAQIQIYEPTEFTDYLHEALFLFSKGRYTESMEPLKKVLEMNNLFDYANMAMGKALYKEGKYDEAIRYARLSKDNETYSDTYWEIRNAWLRRNLTLIATIILVLIIVRLVIRHYDRKKNTFYAYKALKQRLMDKKLIRELRYMFYFMRHPIEGCYGIKHEGRVSLLSSNILLAVVLVFYVVNKYFCGFLVKTVREGSYDVFSDIGMILLVLFLVVGCNYLMCTINDGEGKIKHIYCSFIYSMAPYITFMPFIFLISHVVTNNELFFIRFGQLFMLCWAAVLVFISVREINNYTVGETVKIILLTLFTILIVCLLAFIIYVLWSQVFDFVGSLPREVVYKLGR